MSWDLVIVGCGAAKRDHAAFAAELYTGPYFRSCLAYARTQAPEDRIRILSAKHCLVRLDTVLEPYNLRLGRGDTSLFLAVRYQARHEGLLDARRVLVVAGSAYVRVCAEVWPCDHLTAPLPSQGGLFSQRRWLRRMTLAAVPPPAARPLETCR
jgi:hypothetical protein